MNKGSLFCMAALSAVFILPWSLQAKEPTLEEHAECLLTGVSMVEYPGVPGALTIYGPHSIPLLADENGVSSAALIADDKRHALIFSHDGWFRKSNWNNNGVDTLVGNGLNWLLSQAESRLKSDGTPASHILVFRAPEMAERLRTLLQDMKMLGNRFTVETPKAIPANLQDYAAIILYIPTDTDANFSAQASDELRVAFEQGVPFIAAGIGWVYVDYGGGKKGGDLYNDFAGNRIFSEAGLVFENRHGSSKAKALPADGSGPNLKNLLEQVFATLESGQKKEVVLEADLPLRLWREGAGVLDWDLVSNKKRLDDLLGYLGSIGVSLVPTLQNQVAKNDVWRRTAIVFLELVSRRHPEKTPWLYPLIGEFPGLMGKPAPRDNSNEPLIRKIEVDGSIYRWQTLGLWVNAGDIIRVRLDGFTQGTTALLLLGAHTDELINSGLNRWERWPVIHDSFRVGSDWQEVRCRMSGPLYFRVPDRLVVKSETENSMILEIAGARTMIVWRSDTDPKTFRNELEASDCPFVELMGKEVVFTQERHTLPSNFDPERMMDFWDRAARLAPELIGKGPKYWPQRFVADRQIYIGSMHAGYPIMSKLDVSAYQMGGSGTAVIAKDMQNENVLISGAWGHFHELGHNYQDERWTFNGGTEVTVNLFTLYLMEKLVGIKPLSHNQMIENEAAARRYLANPVWKDWAKNPFVALFTYALPAQEFGWEFFRTAFAAYNDLPVSKTPMDDQSKLDTWVRIYSQALGKNVVPWFKRWGAPVSPSVESALINLSPWSGPEGWR